MPTVSLDTIGNGDPSDATPVNNNFQELQAAINNLDANNWATGKIFAPSKLTQEAASTNQALIWNGSIWAPAGIDPTVMTQGGAGTGQVMVWNGSAWAPTTVPGLLGVVEYNPTTVVAATTTSTTGADVDAANLSLTVTVPSSGKIMVIFSAQCASSTTTYYGLRESTTDVKYVKIFGEAGGSSIATRYTMPMYVSGISAGSHTYKFAFKGQGGSAASARYGTEASPVGTTPGPALMMIWAVN